ncbi:MAG TPA: ABC transporter permease [Streptosporangiaceae bacterium]
MTIPALATAQRPLVTLRRIGAARTRRLGVLGVASASLIVALALVAVLAPFIAPHDPNALDLLHPFAGPSPQHLLGTDDTGRDLLSRLIVGSRTSLLGPLLVVALAVALGVPLAIASAWRRGPVDAVLSRVLDLLFAFPGVLLAILAIALFGAGLPAAIIALAIAHMPYIARVTRAAAIRERELTYVESLQVHGFSGLAICFRHLLPNLGPLIIAQATVSFGYVMVDLAALSFLGLGVQPPSADWGVMVASGEPSILEGHPQQSLYAGILIVAAVCAFTILGERLADPARAPSRG